MRVNGEEWMSEGGKKMNRSNYCIIFVVVCRGSSSSGGRLIVRRAGLINDGDEQWQ